MSWPIPKLKRVEYPTPLSLRIWIPALIAIATGIAAAVLLLWPQGQPTQTAEFWSALIGVPLIACAVVFGLSLGRWEDVQIDAEEDELEQQRLDELWRDWTRRHVSVADAAAFLPVTENIASLASARIDLPMARDRAIDFGWAKDRSDVFRRIKLLERVATRFADVVRIRQEVMVTLMLDDVSLEKADVWKRRAGHILRRVVPGVTFLIEARSASGGAQWLAQQVDQISTVAQLVIAAQMWSETEANQKFSEGAAAFLIDPDGKQAGLIYRPMVTMPDALDGSLAQMMQMQVHPDGLTQVWSTGCEDGSAAIRSALTVDPKNPITEHLLDGFLGIPGPASGWIAVAVAMEAMRGNGPQMVAWREPASEPLHLCMVSPVPQEETTV